MVHRFSRSLLLLPLVVILLCSNVLALDDSPPAYPPFYGSGYVTGPSGELGTVTLYFPITYKSGYLGVDRNGYLYNVSNSSITCYLEGYDYCNIPAWSYPRYREADGNSWEYVDLHISPEYSNCDVATSMEPVMTIGDLLPYASILLLGVLFVCFIRRS